MPLTLDPNINSGTSDFFAMRHKDFGYEYPDDMDLRPGSELHQKIIDLVMHRANEAHRYMSRRYDRWQEVDKTLRAYVMYPTKAKGARQLRREESKGQNDRFDQLIMPVSYANLETLLTYMSAAFVQDPIFRFKGTGPEDVFGAMMLERKIQHDSHRYKAALALHTHWRDAFSYGIGVVSPQWDRTYGYRTEVRERGFYSFLGNMFTPTERYRRRSGYQLKYEGNRLRNVDPYRYLPDPNVAAHDVQEGEFVGWVDRTSYMALLSDERVPANELFNVQYLTMTNGRSRFIEAAQQRENSDANARVTANAPTDVIWMYVRLIPKDWGLGRGKYPEKWLFGVAADSVVITARPLGLDHDQFPITVCAPDTDGYSTAPLGKMEAISDIQALVDFMYRSHILNIRKVLNDSIVFDPALVNVFDLQDSSPGKLIRLRKTVWGRGNIDQAIKQLEVRDVTQQNVEEADYLMSFMQRTVGTTDIAQGVIQNRGPRISATAASTARESVLSRLQHNAVLIDLQSHQDIAHQMASNTQQLMEMETFVEASGEFAQRLIEDFGITPDSDRVPVDPMQLVVDYDVVSHSGTVPGSQDPNLWLQLMQTAGGIPEVAQELDWRRLFKHFARQMGAANVDDFIKRAPRVAPDDVVEQAVQQGNAVPLSDVLGGEGPLAIA